MLTKKDVEALLDFYPRAGIFIWKKNKEVAGCMGCSCRIRINGKQYSTQKLAWFMQHGVWPRVNRHKLPGVQKYADRYKGVQKYGYKYRVVIKRKHVGVYKTLKAAQEAAKTYYKELT